MADLQTMESSAQPAPTAPTPEWEEPKKKVVFGWDWDALEATDNACRWCDSTGVLDADMLPFEIAMPKDDGYYQLERTRLYTSKVHGCQWRVRGREILAGFPPFLLRKAEDGFNWSMWPGKEKPYTDYLDHIDERICAGDGMILIGSVGTGKTHLAVHAGRVAVRERYSVLFTTLTDLLSDLRQTYRDGNELTEARIMELVGDVSLLILDDVAVEKQTDWTQDALYRIVNARYEDEKATIITANMNLEQLRERLGDRLVSRLYERSIVLDFTGADYRLRERKQRKGAT